MKAFFRLAGMKDSLSLQTGATKCPITTFQVENEKPACWRVSHERICHFTEKQTSSQICFQSGAETDHTDFAAVWIPPSSHGWWERSTTERFSHLAGSSNTLFFHTVAVGSEDQSWCQCLLQCNPELRHPVQTQIQPLKLRHRGNSPLFHLRAD